MLRDSKGRFASASRLGMAAQPTPAQAKVVEQQRRVRVTKPRRKLVKPQPPVGTLHVCLAIDESGSMISIAQEVRQLMQQQVESLREGEAKTGIKTTFSLVRFSDHAEAAFIDQPINMVGNLPYSIRGSTALYDGINFGLNCLENSKSDSYLLNVITDGYENASRFTNANDVFYRIKRLMRLGNWTITFQVPDENSKRMLVQLGICNDNINVWKADKYGTQVASEALHVGTQAYFNARSVGKLGVPNFYNVMADLSALKPTDLSKCIDVTGQLKVLEVTKESQIREFVESKGYQYFVGNCYYQLSKPETVKKNKRVIIYDKLSKHYYSGTKAREILGLPKDKDAKVDILSLGKFDCFITSTSINRLLVRGTKLLIDLRVRSDILQPTWDHTAVKV